MNQTENKPELPKTHIPTIGSIDHEKTYTIPTTWNKKHRGKQHRSTYKTISKSIPNSINNNYIQKINDNLISHIKVIIQLATKNHSDTTTQQIIINRQTL